MTRRDLAIYFGAIFIALAIYAALVWRSQAPPQGASYSSEEIQNNSK